MKTALVLGSGSGFGAHVAAALLVKGWHVRLLLKRPAARAEWMAGTEQLIANPSGAADLHSAAIGTDAIIFDNAPTGPMTASPAPGELEALTRVANASGATLVAHQNIYDCVAPRCGSPAAKAHRRPCAHPFDVTANPFVETLRLSGAKALLLRHGDLIGAHATHSPLTHLLSPSKATFRLYCPTTSEALHFWANLPDVASTAVRLLELEAALPGCSVFDFAGYRLAFSDIAKVVQNATARPVVLESLTLRGPLAGIRFRSERWALRGLCRNWDEETSELEDTALRQALSGAVPFTPLQSALIAARVIRSSHGNQLHWAYVQSR